MPREVFALFMVTLFGGFSVILLWPFMRALAERVRPRGAGAENEQLQAQQDGLAEELAQTRHDVAELQERLDFAERLLAKQQDPARIAPPPR
jgi:flagellar biosynthesis/type III secretory pathway M-ring protein FliF/YscJ